MVESRGYKGDFMQDLQIKLKYVKNKIEGKINHPFLAKNIVAPVVDEDKLLLLVSFLEHVKLPLEDIEHYSIPTMLLQVALDTHDKVTNDMSGECNLTSRQLTVLAGTYYSGLYYRMLAEKQDIEVIRLLAEGVETINDQKIIVYEQELTEIEQLMDSLKKIESSLYLKLTNHLDERAWGEVFSNFLFIKRIVSEKEEYLQRNSSVAFVALKKLVFPKHEGSLATLSQDEQNYLMMIFDKYMEYAKQQLVRAKNQLSIFDGMVENRINYMLNQHLPVAKSLVEEG